MASAVKAGFSVDEEEIIASGAQDEPGASRLVQHNHFPSYAPVPDRHLARSGTPGDDSATRWTRMELATAAKGAPHAIALFRFGNSLHPLEDSWSHAGVPDIAITCDHSLAWGHPKKRGGVLSHDADITYKHIPDTEQTAQRVYEKIYLLEYHKLMGGGSQPASWASLQPAVYQFAEASDQIWQVGLVRVRSSGSIPQLPQAHSRWAEISLSRALSAPDAGRGDASARQRR